jgi:hypothetical protein
MEDSRPMRHCRPAGKGLALSVGVVDPGAKSRVVGLGALPRSLPLRAQPSCPSGGGHAPCDQAVMGLGPPVGDERAVGRLRPARRASPCPTRAGVRERRHRDREQPPRAGPSPTSGTRAPTTSGAARAVRRSPMAAAGRPVAPRRCPAGERVGIRESDAMEHHPRHHDDPGRDGLNPASGPPHAPCHRSFGLPFGPDRRVTSRRSGRRRVTSRA